MKISIPCQDLQDAVNKVKAVVSPKSSLPILSHILIETDDSAIRLSATDLKVSIECTVDCTVHEPGSMTASSQRLSSILGELPSGELTMTLGENNVITLECGRIQTRLYSQSPEEFPPMRKFDGVTPLRLEQAIVKRLFSKTSFAICTDQSRYNLTGLLFELKEGRLTVVATDGRRMSLAMETENIPEDAEVKVIIPGKMINEMERLLQDEGEVQVFIDESQAAFEFGRMRLSSALIEGTFPNYDMVIPKKHDKEAVLNTSEFTAAIRRTQTMTNEKFNSVRIGLSDNQVMLRVSTPEVGEYEEELGVEYAGSEMEIAFNPDFVGDILRRMDTDRTCLILKDGSSPGLIKPFGEDGPLDSYVNVVMPIRI